LIKKALFNAIVLLTFSGLAQATTYYVSPIGSDSYNGNSLSTPFQTIQKAANVVNPGDTVYVRNGVYRERVKLAVSGTLNRRIIFKTYAEEQPIIDGSKHAGSWTQYSGQIYQTTVTVNVDPVVIDDTILDNVGNIQQMTEGRSLQFFAF